MVETPLDVFSTILPLQNASFKFIPFPVCFAAEPLKCFRLLTQFNYLSARLPTVYNLFSSGDIQAPGYVGIAPHLPRSSRRVPALFLFSLFAAEAAGHGL